MRSSIYKRFTVIGGADMVTEQKDEKVTYTTMSVEQAQGFNAAYDRALERAMSDVGRHYTPFANDTALSPSLGKFEDRSPNDTRILLGTFDECGTAEADAAVSAARIAFHQWSRTDWRERLRLMRRAAQLFRERKYDIAAWLTLEAGKTRLEAIGEVEEAADLIFAYSDYMDEHRGFVLPLEQLSPNERNRSVLRPYGVWVVIAPFNFPVALATGMVAGALIGGNTVVFKPSEETPLAGVKVYECLRDAGLPAGAINYVTGRGNEIGQALSAHRNVDGIAFTGSRAVGTKVYADFSRDRPRPCIAEMGGKNPVIVTGNADLEKAVEGTVRAAFGFSGQKCSAASRVYVEKDVAGDFRRGLIERTARIAVDNAAAADAFMGPVINQKAYVRFAETCRRAGQDGTILIGGEHVTDGDKRHGYYCSPTIAELPPDHPHFFEELFVPLLAFTTVDSLDQALELANDSEYGLTAGIFSEEPEEIEQFKNRIEAGVIYVNRRAGATTGAWPKVQSFGGWKASGSTGKSALGPYYVQQFMHEQSQTIVED